MSAVAVLILWCFLLGLLWYWSTRRPAADFPPGPRPLPLVGNIFEFSSDPPHIVFLKLGQRYGDIFSIKIGQRWTVVLNSVRATRQALLKQPITFAGRPDLSSFELLSGGGKSIALSDYSVTWAKNRKLLHTSLRNLITGDKKRFESFILGFTPELSSVLDETKGVPFDPKELICQLVYSTLGKLCFGVSHAFNDPKLVETMKGGQAFLALVGNGLPTDFFPSFSWIPFERVNSLLSFCDKNFTRVRKAIEVHRQTSLPGKVRDFIDVMLEAQADTKETGVESISDDFIATAVTDIHGGGTDTTIVTLYWTLALMVEFPHVQDKIAELTDEVIGRERLPTLADRDRLAYVVATVHEILRYSTKLPLCVPHSTTKDTTLDGYFIPKDTMVMINIWAMHRDEKYWKDPYNFKPEHFLDDSGTVRQHPESFMPFSTGRRVCIGESMVKGELFLILTWLFQHYKFSKVPGTEDQSYIEHGQVLVANEVKPYKIVATRRF